MTYAPTADVFAVGDTDDIFINNKATLSDVSASDSLILQLDNIDTYPVGTHTVTISVGLSAFAGITAYQVLVPFAVYDCSTPVSLPDDTANVEFGTAFSKTFMSHWTFIQPTECYFDNYRVTITDKNS